jgi:hypothetical protein
MSESNGIQFHIMSLISITMPKIAGNNETQYVCAEK